jgi:hypothetical protein
MLGLLLGHASMDDGGIFVLLLPTGLLLLVGLLVIFHPRFAPRDQPGPRPEDEEDLAATLLGADEAQEMRKRARRQRAVRRRTLRKAAGQNSDGDTA